MRKRKWKESIKLGFYLVMSTVYMAAFFFGILFQGDGDLEPGMVYVYDQQESEPEPIQLRFFLCDALDDRFLKAGVKEGSVKETEGILNDRRSNDCNAYCSVRYR